MPYADRHAELSARKWRRIRAYVLSRSRICALCGKPGADTVDHIIPVSLGGSLYDLANLRPACAACNYKRGNGTRPPRPDPIPTSRDW